MIDKKNAPSNCGEFEEANKPEQDKNTNFIQKLKAEIQSKSMNFNANDTVFPTNGLPQVILDFAIEVSKVYGVPLEFPALSALCAVVHQSGRNLWLTVENIRISGNCGSC